MAGETASGYSCATTSVVIVAPALRQQVCDVDHKLRLDRVVNIARRTLVDNLEQIAKDILTGEIIDEDDETVDGEDGK